MVYKITLSGFRAFCTVRTAKTKPINNISILWGKHHLRTLYCDEGHSCCRKGFIPFAIIVLCCFFYDVDQYFSSAQEYVHVHFSPNYFTWMPLMFNIYPHFFFFKFCYYRSGDQAYPKGVKSKSNFINSSHFIYFFVTKKKKPKPDDLLIFLIKVWLCTLRSLYKSYIDIDRHSLNYKKTLINDLIRAGLPCSPK